MKRAALGLLFAASAGCLASSLAAPLAWVVAAAGLVSMARSPSGSMPIVAAPARRVLGLGVAATLGFGWLVMVYPVMSPETMRLWSLVLGVGLGVLGAFFLLTEPAEEAWSSAIPAAVGMLVVSSFDLEARVQPYLWTTGAAGFLFLAADVVPAASRRLARALMVTIFGCVAAGVAVLIVIVLPWTQGKVEETVLTLYSPTGDGMESQNRARLGELARLKLSKKVVMRVWSERPQRLRTRVLERFDGSGWARGVAGARELAPATALRGLDAASREFLDTLPGTDFAAAEERLEGQRFIRSRVVRVDGGGLATPGGSLVLHAPLEQVRLGPAGEWVQAADARVRVYGVLHEVDHQRAQYGPLEATAREAYLQLPDGIDPRFAELAARLTASASSTESAVETVVEHLRGNYRYALDVGQMDARDPLADFLFVKKRGWCEYFAGAAAVLLRTQGIPTRYVRGFNVIGSQKLGDHYVVRDWDRHAWIEAYIEGKGWLEYDPTPPAEYESLHATLDDGALSRAVEWLRMQMASLYALARHLEWSTLLRPFVGLVALLLAVLIAVRARRLWRSRPRRAPTEIRAEPTELERLLAELETRGSALGSPRPKSRGLLEHWRGLDASGLPAALQTIGIQIVETYYRARYGGSEPTEEQLRRLWVGLHAAER